MDALLHIITISNTLTTVHHTADNISDAQQLFANYSFLASYNDFNYKIRHITEDDSDNIVKLSEDITALKSEAMKDDILSVVAYAIASQIEKLEKIYNEAILYAITKDEEAE